MLYKYISIYVTDGRWIQANDDAVIVGHRSSNSTKRKISNLHILCEFYLHSGFLHPTCILQLFCSFSNSSSHSDKTRVLFDIAMMSRPKPFASYYFIRIACRRKQVRQVVTISQHSVCITANEINQA